MARRPSPDQLLNDLAVVRRDLTAPAAREALSKALASTASVVVEKAARLIEELTIAGLTSPLAAAFEVMMAGSDRGCAARTAIAKAMLATDAGSDATPAYLRGIRHRQFDGPPVGGRPSDTAGPLRGYCGLGLLSVRHPDALVELTELLADEEPAARTAAARGLASTGREEAALLLRLRIRAGEASGDVLTECVTGMLRLDAERALPLVERLLAEQPDDVRDAVAFGLADWRSPAALPLLRAAFDRESDSQVRQTMIRGGGLIRSPDAVDWLVSLVRDGAASEAAVAVDALLVYYRRDAAVAEGVRAAAAGRGDGVLERALRAWHD